MPAGDVNVLRRKSLRLAWGAATDVGKVRRVNEDSHLALPGLFVVADGMGGHHAGDVASGLTVDVARDVAAGVPLQLDQVAALVTEANDRVRRHAREAGREGMGTTVVGIAVIDNAGEDGLVVFNVGDSRCYEVDVDGVVNQVTSDHSLVQELVDGGSIDASEAMTHPDRHVVTRAIGIDDHVVADYVVLPPGRSRRLLLCSDGVSSQVAPERIAGLLDIDDDPFRTARALVAAVIEGDAPDNATAIVVDLEWTDDEAGDERDITGPRPVSDTTGPRPMVEVAVEPPELIDRVPPRDEPARESARAIGVISEVPE